MSHTYPYPRPALTADAVVFTILDQKLHILLIRRGGEPFRGPLGPSRRLCGGGGIFGRRCAPGA